MTQPVVLPVSDHGGPGSIPEHSQIHNGQLSMSTGFPRGTLSFPCQYHSTSVAYSLTHLPSTQRYITFESEVK